jgi:hypothetical protein
MTEFKTTDEIQVGDRVGIVSRDRLAFWQVKAIKDNGDPKWIELKLKRWPTSEMVRRGDLYPIKEG